MMIIMTGFRSPHVNVGCVPRRTFSEQLVPVNRSVNYQRMPPQLVHVRMSKAFLQRQAKSVLNRPLPVTDQILGTTVRGMSSTAERTELILLPDSRQAPLNRHRGESVFPSCRHPWAGTDPCPRRDRVPSEKDAPARRNRGHQTTHGNRGDVAIDPCRMLEQLAWTSRMARRSGRDASHGAVDSAGRIDNEPARSGEASAADQPVHR